MSAMNYIFQNGLRKEMKKHFDEMFTEMLIANAEFEFVSAELAKFERGERPAATVEALTKRFFDVRRRVLIAAKTVQNYADRIREMVLDPPEIEPYVKMAQFTIELLETPESAELESELAAIHGSLAAAVGQ